MADKTNYELHTIANQPSVGLQLTNDFLETRAKEDEVRLKQETAPIGDKAPAFFNQVAKNMYPIGWGEEAIFMSMDNTPNFKMDDDTAIEILTRNNMSVSAYLPDIKKSKSIAEAEARVLTYKRQEEEDIFITNSLDTDGYAYKAATLTGIGLGMGAEVVGDIAVGNVVGAVGAIGVTAMNRIRTIKSIQSSLTKTNSIAKTLTIASAETGLAYTKSILDDNYDEIDFATDIVIGTFAGSLGSSPYDNFRHHALESKYKSTRDNLFKTIKTNKNTDVAIKELDDQLIDIDKKLREMEDLSETRKASLETGKDILVRERNRVLLQNIKAADDLTFIAIHKQILKDLPTSIKNIRESVFLTGAKALRAAKTNTELLEAYSKHRSLVMFDIMATNLSKNSTEIKEIVATNLNKSDVAEIIKTFKETDSDKFEFIDKLLGAKSIDDIEAFAKKKLGSKMTGKQVAAVVAIAGALAPTSAMASDGEISFSDFTSVVALGVIGLFVGSRAIEALKKTGSDSAWYGLNNVTDYLKHSIDDASKKTDLTMKSGKYYKLRAWASNIIDTKLTGVKSYFKTPAASELVEKMVLSPESIDMTRRILVEGNLAKLDEIERTRFKDYIDELKINDNMFKNVDNIRDEFNRLATEYRMNRNLEVPQAVKNYITDSDNILKELYTYAADVGAFGYKDVVKGGFDEDFLPRYWRSQKLGGIVKELTDLGLEGELTKLSEQLEKGFISGLQKKYPKRTLESIKKQAKSEAKSLITHWKQDPVTTISREMDEDTIEVLRGYFKEDADMDALLKDMGKTQEMSNRVKRRLDFDIAALDDIDIRLNGRTITMSKNDFIDMDFHSIMKRTINTVGSDASLAKHGFESRARLRKHIANITKDPEEASDLNLIADMLEGKPISAGSKTIDDVLAYTSAATAVAKLSLVGVSTFPEMFNVLTSNGLLNGIKTLTTALLRKYPPKGNVMKVAELTGLASFGKRISRTGFIDITDTDYIIGNMAKSKKLAKKLSDKAMQYNGLSFLSDTSQLGGIDIALNKLSQYVHTGKGINPARLKDLGIDDNFIKLIEPYIENGKFKDIDFNSMDMDTRIKFASVIRNIVQGIAPETMIRDTGLWTRTGVGRTLTPLLTYTQTLFNEQGIKGVKYMDRLAATQMLNAFIGGYVGMTIRDGITGKERSDDMKIYYSMLNTPILGAGSTALGILNPAPLGVIKDAYNAILPKDIEVR